MTITIESTTRTVVFNGVDCRVWEGQTARGVAVQVLIPRIAVKNGLNTTEFEADLQECKPPSADAIECFPLRMLL